MNSKDLVEYLRDLRFIGPFPHGVEVLLVPTDTAYHEALGFYPELKITTLKLFLRTENVLIFSSLEDYVKYMGTIPTRRIGSRKPRDRH